MSLSSQAWLTLPQSCYSGSGLLCHFCPALRLLAIKAPVHHMPQVAFPDGKHTGTNRHSLSLSLALSSSFGHRGSVKSPWLQVPRMLQRAWRDCEILFPRGSVSRSRSDHSIRLTVRPNSAMYNQRWRRRPFRSCSMHSAGWWTFLESFPTSSWMRSHALPHDTRSGTKAHELLGKRTRGYFAKRPAARTVHVPSHI